MIKFINISRHKFFCINSWLLNRTYQRHSVICDSVAHLVSVVVVDNKKQLTVQKTEKTQPSK